MMTKEQNITLALAGIFQTAALINEIAHHGNCEQSALTASINSIYKVDSNSVTEVFTDVSGVRFGLVQLERLFDNNKTFPQAIMRYVIGMLYLEKCLRKSKKLMDDLTSGLKRLNRQLDYYAALDGNMINNLAELFKDVFNQLDFRIQIIGKREYLTPDDLAAKVRALLLAGVRAAVLWRQLGGTRWNLLFRRSTIQHHVKTLLAQT
jgi:high frequency lysogenization protein